MRGIITKTTGSRYVIKDEDKNFWNATLRGQLKIKNTKATNLIAVGDWVEFMKVSENNAVIRDLIKRKNYIIRNAPKLSKLYHIIASNVDLTVILTSLSNPRLSLGLVDRILVTCEAYRVPAIIVLTKVDEWSEKDFETAQHVENIYSPLGYKTVRVSVKKTETIKKFKKIIQNKNMLFIGKSGVGKTSLINSLIPNLKLKTKELSKKTNKGKHCTTFAEMFFLNEHTQIIDTPGIKEFALSDMNRAEFCHYFPEMRERANTCKFNNCLHLNEKNCAILKALQLGDITFERYRSYVSFFEEEQYKKKKKY